MKQISCGTEEFFNFEFQYFRDVVLYEHYRLSGRPHRENPAAGEFGDIPKREQIRQKATWSEYRDCYKKQRCLYSDNVALNCLTLAISSLPALTTVEIIDLSEEWWSNSRCYTPRALLKKLRLLRDDMLLLTDILIPLPRGGRQLRVLLQVLAESERRIEDFRIRLFSRGVGGKSLLFPLCKTLKSSADYVFSNIRELSIALPDLPLMEYDILPQKVLSTCTIAQAAHGLERLCIEMPDVETETSSPPRFINIFGERKIGNLKDVRIIGATLFEADFEAFLLKSCLGLQIFHLHNARLVEGSWNPIFNAIRRMQCLKQLDLYFLRYNIDGSELDFTTLFASGMPPEPLYDYLLRRCDINPVARMIDEEKAREDEEAAIAEQESLLKQTVIMRASWEVDATTV